MHFARTIAAAAALLLAGAANASAVIAADAWTGSSSLSVINGQTLSFSGADNTSAASYTLDGKISASKVLVEFDLNFAAGQIDDNDFLSLWLGSSTGINVGVKGNCDGAAGCNGADLFVRTNGSGGAFTTPLTVGSSYHLYALLEKVNGASVYNRYSLWVNPTSSEMSSFTGADAVYNGASSTSGFDLVGFRTANLDSGDVIQINNVSISAVPEPGTFALAALALLGVGVTARKRKSLR